MMIRKATTEDLIKVANIEIDSGYKWKESRRKELKYAARFLNSKSVQTYILEKQNKGIAYFAINVKNKNCHILLFSVIKPYHRKSIGKRLMKKIISIAKNSRCKTIQLGVWAKNFPAVGLYNKFGFYVILIKKKYYPNGDDKLIMERRN